MPKHKKNPDVGEKKTVFSSSILIEQEDALSFDFQEEITLMDWGNAIVRAKVADSTGKITEMEMDLHLEGDFRKTKKKVTWLAAPTTSHPLVDATLLDFDYLITKKKLEEDDDVKDFVTPVTEFREEVLADANVVDLKKGDIMQFERKGYYIFDGKAENGRLEFIHIPDGRAASIASKAAPAPTSASAPTTAPAAPSKPTIDEAKAAASDTPVDTKMYHVSKVYGEGDVGTPAETKMYTTKNVYSS